MEDQFKENAPYSVVVLVLGICSIVASGGFVCGIIALILASKGFKQYKMEPERYKNPQMLKAGQICAIVGLSIALFFTILATTYLVFLFGNKECSQFCCHFDGQTLNDFFHRLIDCID